METRARWVFLAIGVIAALLTLNVGVITKYPDSGHQEHYVEVSIYHLIGFQFGGSDWGPYVPLSYLNPL